MQPSKYENNKKRSHCVVDATPKVPSYRPLQAARHPRDEIVIQTFQRAVAIDTLAVRQHTHRNSPTASYSLFTQLRCWNPKFYVAVPSNGPVVLSKPTYKDHRGTAVDCKFVARRIPPLAPRHAHHPHSPPETARSWGVQTLSPLQPQARHVSRIYNLLPWQVLSPVTSRPASPRS